MAAQFTKHFVQDLTQDIKIRQCGTIVFNTDNDSNVIEVELYNGETAYADGGTVSGACICPDGSTVALSGTLDGNLASVTLTGDCFAIQGQIGIGVQVTSGTTKTTVLKAIYNVELLETDTVVDPGSRLTISVADLVNDIETAVASIPADYSDLLAAIAPTFSASTAYSAGAYVWYEGDLYRFTSAHAAGSWTGTDAEAAVVCTEIKDIQTDVSDLKSAVTHNDIAAALSYSFGYINGSGNIASSTTHYISAMIPVEAGGSYNYYGYESGNIFAIGFYETSESTTAMTAVSIGAPQTTKSIDFEVPIGAKFMRVGYHKDYGKPTIYKRTAQNMLWTSLEQNLSYPNPGFIFYNDGSVASNNAFHCTDFIEIRGTILKMQMPFYSQASIAFYDSTKTYIADSSVRNTSTSAQTGDSRIYTVEIPSSAKYFRTSKADALSNTYFSGAIAADDSEAIREIKNKTGLSNEILCPSKLFVAQDMPVYYYPLQMALNSKKFETPTVLYQESFTSANKWNRQNQKDFAYMTYNSDGNMTMTMKINHVKNDNTVEEIASKSVDVISYAKPTDKTAKVLVIGDSYFNYPWITDTTQGSVGEGVMSQIDVLATADGNTVQFMGTKLEYTTAGGTAYYGEAYGGWKATDFTGTSSPFYIDGTACNFTDYFTTNGTPDIVLFFLGMNYADGSGIDTMITAIKSASASTKIIVCTVPPWPKYWTAVPDDLYAKELRRQNQNKNYLALFDGRTNDGIIVCPIHMTFERTFHYIHSNTKAATYPDEYAPYFTQCYNNHPSANGAKTIAYVVYDYLLYFMKDM